MNLKLITDALCLITVIGLSIYDVFPAINSTRGDTISEAVQYAATKVVIIPYVMGILLGHWFLPRRMPVIDYPQAVFLLMWITWAVFFAGVALRNAGVTTGSHVWYSYFLVNFGIFCGHLLWPLRPIIE